MAHVSVTINGRQYRMACDDGQEIGDQVGHYVLQNALLPAN